MAVIDQVFPMPGTRLCGRTVVASCNYRDLMEIDKQYMAPDDDWPDIVDLVLLLNEEKPFFTVAYVTDDGFAAYRILAEEDHFNIVHAVEAYQEWGGDV
jgi:hypothetical protein